ncbi:putative non-heme dioxygenase domain, isopenicillin N synthase [Helianthus annuus]|nr:putative non-heme dioxygenase domain, isopenicillin N synthase [Helianthus annuus]
MCTSVQHQLHLLPLHFSRTSLIREMEIPVIDLTPYVDVASGKFSCDERLHPELKTVCLEVSRILKETGALLVRDPRCSNEDNDRFIDMMEKYFEQPKEVKRVQERPHQHYQ